MDRARHSDLRQQQNSATQDLTIATQSQALNVLIDFSTQGFAYLEMQQRSTIVRSWGDAVSVNQKNWANIAQATVAGT